MTVLMPLALARAGICPIPGGSGKSVVVVFVLGSKIIRASIPAIGPADAGSVMTVDCRSPLSDMVIIMSPPPADTFIEIVPSN